MIPDCWKDLIRDAIKGDVTDTQIKYLAWGDGVVAPDHTNIALGNELGRKAVTSRAAGGTGILDTIIYLSQSEAVASIKELGLFGGATASVAPGSGTLACRFTYTRNKTALEAIQIDLKDTIVEG